MKTALNCSLVLCLVLGFFAFPTPGLASDTPPPGGFPAVLSAPATPGTHYLSLTGLDFFPTDSDMPWSELNGGLYIYDTSSGFEFSASYHLPDGAAVELFTFYYVDNSGSSITLSASTFTPATALPHQRRSLRWSATCDFEMARSVVA